MNKVIGYIKDSVEEVRTNVTWTATPELQKFTTIVVISLIVLTILVFIMDKVSEFVLLDTIYKSL
jgi:preprotein translocase subunit SecE